MRRCRPWARAARDGQAAAGNGSVPAGSPARRQAERQRESESGRKSPEAAGRNGTDRQAAARRTASRCSRRRKCFSRRIRSGIHGMNRLSAREVIRRKLWARKAPAAITGKPGCGSRGKIRSTNGDGNIIRQPSLHPPPSARIPWQDPPIRTRRRFFVRASGSNPRLPAQSGAIVV